MEAVNAATGRDIWAELGGCPRSWREAARIYRRLGVTNLADAVTAVVGPPIPARRAMRGDIVMVNGALGICAGEVAVCMDATLPMRRAQMAWSAHG